MEVIHELQSLELRTDSVAAVGVFDGVHLGHQAVLAETTRRAAEHGVPAVAIVRESPVDGRGMLTTIEHRLELIARLRIDWCPVASDGDPWPPNVPAEAIVGVAPVALSGEREPISSSGICGALTRGNVERAAAMLGRAHDVTGVVEHC